MSSFMPADSVKVPKRARLETEEEDVDEEEHGEVKKTRATVRVRRLCMVLLWTTSRA